MPRPNRIPAEKRYEKRRCLYCFKLFDLTKPNKKFCRLHHQQAYNREGMAFGPLREKLPKWISKEVAKQLGQLETKLRAEFQAMLSASESSGV